MSINAKSQVWNSKNGSSADFGPISWLWAPSADFELHHPTVSSIPWHWAPSADQVIKKILQKICFFFQKMFFCQLIRSAADISWSDQKISWFIWSTDFIWSVYLIWPADMTWTAENWKKVKCSRQTDWPTDRHFCCLQIYFSIYTLKYFEYYGPRMLNVQV